ncbi:ATP-binding protein [Breoghania sp. JC706]|uniref:ATP-binding protein n=1 Tax=Breoghania sp. JC706 TaxID=3117732 RepID=UPI003008FC58
MSRDVQWYIEAFQNFPDAIVVLDAAGLIVFTNTLFEQLSGFAPTELIGKDASHFVGWPELPGPETGGLLPSGWSPPVPGKLRRNGRSTLDTVISSFNIMDDEGRCLGKLGHVQPRATSARLLDFLDAIDACSIEANEPIESWIAAVLALGSDYFGTDFGALCLPDGTGRFEVCLDSRQVSDAHGEDRTRMEDLAREVVGLAGSLAKSARPSGDSPPSSGGDQGMWRFVSAPVRIPGQAGGTVLFGNRSGTIRPFEAASRIGLSAIAQIIAGHIPPGGLSAQRGDAVAAVAATEADRRGRERQREITAEDRYQAAFRVAPAKLLMLDWRGVIGDATDQFLRHFEYGRLELVGRSFHELVPQEMRKAADAATDPVGGAFARTGGIPLVMSTRQGRPIDVEIAIIRQPYARVIVAVTDLGERNEARSRVEQRNTELELLNQNLQNFASIASHDMQEPLRKIRYFSEMLQRALVEENQDDVDYALEVLASASRRASRLVSDLLTFSRSSSESLLREPIDLGRMVEGLVEEIRQEEAAHDAEIMIDIPQVVISGDPTAVMQLFRNLIGNSLKYRSSARAPRVLICARVGEGEKRRLQVAIDDNGIGFEPQYAETILQPFRRLHRRQEIPGSGIGLAICDMVARRHGWRLVAEGRPGEGATFTVHIPEFELGPVKTNTAN